MGVICCHGRRLSAALVFILFFTTATSRRSAAIAHTEEELSSTSPRRWEKERLAANRQLAGPGSSPPTCRLRCGRCLPCRPVHVPIQPGVAGPLEYYPEAWRCKCGDKLFIP
ncbi:hypothetical protein HPP92_009617 [Vanilla planifolia]|uniref:Epidermal patterning factor-like protein n=1 Tax=Vanilla planifolia TaxID=51239 RepID=A0A835RFN4_VANPL|nr:hypothetical protein HPP92_009617 [Vanilla planifolia]